MNSSTLTTHAGPARAAVWGDTDPVTLGTPHGTAIAHRAPSPAAADLHRLNAAVTASLTEFLGRAMAAGQPPAETVRRLTSAVL